MEEKTKKEIELALIKRAVGYDAKEVVEEFSQSEEGEERLCKRKVTGFLCSRDYEISLPVKGTNSISQ